jgi:hypothetical protein
MMNNDTDKDIYEDADDDSSGNIGGGRDGDNSNNHGENSNKGSEVEVGELHIRTDELRAEYTEFLKHHKWTAKHIQCMDRAGTFY